MSRLKLILGPPGSGKTEAVLREAAALAYASPLNGPPLLVIVPEQQAVQTERALLLRMEALRAADTALSPEARQRPVAVSRLRVMSLTRLANQLAEAAGEQSVPPGELGRRLLVWRLLARLERALATDPAHELSVWLRGRDKRQANAELLSEMLAELAQRGLSADELRQAAAHLDAADSTAEKLRALAAFQQIYEAECSERGLQFHAPAAGIPALLSEQNWPGLGETRVWVDGFADFTPPEERALKALLTRSGGLTATLLLDRERAEGPRPFDIYDCYVPTRGQYRRWLALAAGLDIETVWLEGAPRWLGGSPLAEIAQSGLSHWPLEPAGPTPSGEVAGQSESPAYAAAWACPDERAEVDRAVLEILALLQDGIGGRPLRYGEISLIARQLKPYAELLRARLGECGIPCFIDARRGIAQHPAVELLRCGLRLALDCAAEDDVVTLLRCGLLPLPENVEDEYSPVDALCEYAQAHGLKARHWLEEQPWRRWKRLLRREDDEALQQAQEEAIRARLTALDAWRCRLLSPIFALRESLHSSADNAPLEAAGTLALAWEALFDARCQQLLSNWELSETVPEKAELHRAVLPAIAGLLDEIAAQSSGLKVMLQRRAALSRLDESAEDALSGSEVCAWLENGLSKLSLGFPPPRLDTVLVTEIERGRHHPVRATILLGLAEDSWPPPAQEGLLLSGAERETANAALGSEAPGQAALLSGGASERADREPYLALVAATRASERLVLLRPLADGQGRKRPASPYYLALLASLGVGEQQLGEEGQLLPLPAEIITRLALTPADERLARIGARASTAAPAAWQALGWGRELAARGSGLSPLPAGVLAQLYRGEPGSRLLSCSASRLETFAGCPFKHFARYNLRLAEAEAGSFGVAELGGFYHSVFDRLVSRLNAEAYDWLADDPADASRAAQAELAAAGRELLGETGRESAAYILERAGVLLEHHLEALREQLTAAQRSPRFTELAFGREGQFPALELPLASGRLRLSGYLDRLDIDPSGGATVVDYKLGASKVSWGRFLCGAQIQLFTYLLAVEGLSIAPLSGGRPVALHPAGGELQRIEPAWDKDRAEFTADGIVPSFKTEKKQASVSELLPNALLQTREILTQLGERILGGEIRPFPLRELAGRGSTACAWCSYRPVCRFDPAAGDAYRDAPRESDGRLRDAIAEGRSLSELLGGERA